MIKTLTLPMVWNRYGSSYGSAADEIRLGWREFNFINHKYNSWAKFNVSEVLALNLQARHIVSAKIVMFLNATDNDVSCKVYNTLKPATSGANWNTYNGTNSWTVPGGEGSGTDHGSELANASNFGQATVEIPLSGAALMEAVVTSNGIFSFITTSPQGINDYIVAYSTTYPPYLSVTYNKPSVFDAVIF